MEQIFLKTDGLNSYAALKIYREDWGKLLARLTHAGAVYEETIVFGHDITVTINGVDLLVIIHAVSMAGDLVVSFCAQSGEKICVEIRKNKLSLTGRTGPEAA